MRAANPLELLVIVEACDFDDDIFGLAAFLEEQHV
jgi:hypothetical protein